MSKETEWIEPDEHKRERLYKLIEELNEAQHIATKILRFGYDEIYPATQTTNKARLEVELGDVLVMIDYLTNCGDISCIAVEEARQIKKHKLSKFIRGNWA